MCFEIMRRAGEQKHGPDKVRHSRWAIIRNTYRELMDTTLKTWLYWFEEGRFGPFRRGDMTHRIRVNDIDLEVIFRALDRPDDVKKLLSLELTGAWVNEAREIPKGVVDSLSDCVERFPNIESGGCTWSGVIMDTNAPDDDSWWYRMAEEETPLGWEFWKQPGGLLEIDGKFVVNEKAENLKNLAPNYYLKRMAGKKDGHIRVYYCSQYGFFVDGRPVYPEYVDNLHCTDEILKPVPGIPITVGLDFGLTPAAVFGQLLPNGRKIWFDELVTEDMGTKRFAEILAPKMRGEYKDFEFEVWGDPSGDNRSQTDETTPFEILREEGIHAKPAPSNDWLLRRESVAVPLSRLFDGKPGLLISPRCKVLRKGMGGGYCLRRVKIVGEDRYRDKPEKDRFSHVCEAGQYEMLGTGGGTAVVGKPKIQKNPFANRGQHIHPEQAGTSWMGA